MKCNNCNGDGFFKCKTCSGEGIDYGVHQCDSCSGTGEFTCKSCGGKGKIKLLKKLKSN
ncbi:hypothetical protein GCM10011351_27260 [Paraliobacillus quinghaiensis]|uniref:Uncharacterized protein n=1 Tax=Paraliobacillus quinghaiensis TaxID=470815 RepID=A0A917WY50_9BACI|nr:hypothetical protein GCM10011351_27260 [Paraliobacillus quinghaiensis]